MLQLQHIESICLHYFLDLSLPFHFLTIEESVYRIQLYLNLFYEDYDAIKSTLSKTNSLTLFFFLLILLDIFAKKIQIFF